MGKVFFTSDTHFCHANILKYENRPFKDKEDMNECLIRKWNNVVSKGDQVYILGDFCFGTKEEIVKIANRLNGEKFLILGNHDYKVKQLNLNERKCFGWIKDYYVLKHNGMKFVLFHFPILEWDSKHYGSILLHGHIHSRPLEHKLNNSYNVGVDVNNYAPIEIEDILKKLN